jgi:hypothetical protein
MNIYSVLVQATRYGSSTAASAITFANTEAEALVSAAALAAQAYPAADGWYTRPSVSLAGELWGMVVAGGHTFKSTSQAEAERLTRNLIADVTKLDEENARLRAVIGEAEHNQCGCLGGTLREVIDGSQ